MFVLYSGMNQTKSQAEFKLVAPFHPTGDQPAAITQIVQNLEKGLPHQILLGVTGSGKTFTMANVINQVQKPTLVLAHNKTLAAQLFAELREFFPDNSVQYFVSYYDYYQPEAYIPHSDTYIAKEADINQEIEKFRHASTHALLTRKDVIIVASVSCIYGLGSPEIYRQANLEIKVGEKLSRDQMTRRLTDLMYERNDLDLRRGKFQIAGDTVTIFPAYEDYQIQLTQFGDLIESIVLKEPVTGNKLKALEQIEIFPAKHYLTEENVRLDIVKQIESDLEKEYSALKDVGKVVEAARLKERVSYDLEMIRATGSVNGIENYSRYFDQRAPGTAPSVLLDYFPKDYLLIIDESHISIPQVNGMYNGDRSRKTTLIDYGFRLRAALDNRPLTFAEFVERQGQTVYTSATPGEYELKLADGAIVEQLIRPTGILDPEVIVRSTKGQIQDLEQEIRSRIAKNERTLITTLTKRMAEDVSEYLRGQGLKVNYLHSDIETIERTTILQDLRKGVYDCLVGINLLREGLDLPEVSLVAILDADKEGFLRSGTAFIQTIGRAARHPEGKVIMYADRVTGSMQFAISETERRRKIQADYNQANGIVPKLMLKPILNTLPTSKEEASEDLKVRYTKMKRHEKLAVLEELKEKMRQAALHLEFEEAASLRDQIKELVS